MNIDVKEYSEMTDAEKEEAKNRILRSLHLTEEEWNAAMRALEVSYLLLSMTNELSERSMGIVRKGRKILGEPFYLLGNAVKAFDLFHRCLAAALTDPKEFCKGYEGLGKIIADYLAHTEEEQNPETRMRMLRQDLEEQKRRVYLLQKGVQI